MRAELFLETAKVYSRGLAPLIGAHRDIYVYSAPKKRNSVFLCIVQSLLLFLETEFSVGDTKIHYHLITD